MDPLQERPTSAVAPRVTFPWRNLTLFLLTGAVVALCWRMALPFMPAVVGAITLAVITYRPYRWLEAKVGRPSLASALAVVAVTLSIITPLFFLIEELTRQALGAAVLLHSGEPQIKVQAWLTQHPGLAARVSNAAEFVNLQQASQRTAGYLAGHLGHLLSNSLSAVTQLVLMMFMLFFAYRDRKLAVSALRSLLPLADAETDLLLERARGTIEATALGRFIVATVQGVLAGLAYLVLGVPGAVFWGMATLVAAMIPAIGALLVWGPLAVYLAITGHWVRAIILAAWSGAVVSTIDNFLYPALVGSRLQQHTVGVLISILGGVALFGVPGLILGPLLLTAATTLLEIWGRKTAEKTTQPMQGSDSL